jgi:hypothetical protein
MRKFSLAIICLLLIWSTAFARPKCPCDAPCDCEYQCQCADEPLYQVAVDVSPKGDVKLDKDGWTDWDREGWARHPASGYVCHKVLGLFKPVPTTFPGTYNPTPDDYVPSSSGGCSTGSCGNSTGRRIFSGRFSGRRCR